MAKRSKPAAGTAVVPAEVAGVPLSRSGNAADFPVVGSSVVFIVQHLDTTRTGLVPEWLLRVTAALVEPRFSGRRRHGQAIEHVVI